MLRKSGALAARLLRLQRTLKTPSSVASLDASATKKQRNGAADLATNAVTFDDPNLTAMLLAMKEVRTEERKSWVEDRREERQTWAKERTKFEAEIALRVKYEVCGHCIKSRRCSVDSPQTKFLEAETTLVRIKGNLNLRTGLGALGHKTIVVAVVYS